MDRYVWWTQNAGRQGQWGCRCRWGQIKNRLGVTQEILLEAVTQMVRKKRGQEEGNSPIHAFQ